MQGLRRTGVSPGGLIAEGRVLQQSLRLFPPPGTRTARFAVIPSASRITKSPAAAMQASAYRQQASLLYLYSK